MEELTLLRDLAIVLAAGAVVTALFHRLGQPIVLGYILAGVLIGPHSTPIRLVSDPHSIEILAELGVILLLFSLGLNFNLRRLRQVGSVAIIVAALEIPFMIWLGYTVGWLAGWDLMDRIFLGAILSMSSTTIIVKALMDLGLMRTEFARIILGILIVEDIAVVLLLVVLTGLATAGSFQVLDLAASLSEVMLFVTSVMVLGLLVVPRLIHRLAAWDVPEVMTVTALGLCFAVSILGAELGLSVALGAFLVGVVIAESREARSIEERIEPIRDMFMAIFFVAVGLQIDPVLVFENVGIVVAISLVVILGKLSTCSFGTLVAGYPPRTAIRVGLGLSPIGEFSFVMANIGLAAGVVTPSLYTVTVAVSAVTTLAAPYCLRYADRVSSGVSRLVPGALAEFLEFYDRKIRDRLRERVDLRLPDEARRPVTRAVLSGLLLLALLGVASAVSSFVRERLPEPVLFANDLQILVWSVAGILSFPLVFGLWRAGGELAGAMSRRALAGEENRTLSEAIRFSLTVIVGVVFLAVASPVLPTGVPLIVTTVVVATAGLFFWRSLFGVHERAERLLDELFQATGPGEVAPPATARRELADLVSARYPFEVALEDVILPFGKTRANRPIRKLRIRSETGATIAAIYRDERPIVNPGPDEELEPGDLVLLMGSPEQVKKAMQYLEELMR